MSCNFMSCNFDGPSFSCPSFSVNPTASIITNLYTSPVCAFLVLYPDELNSTQGHVRAEPHDANLASRRTTRYLYGNREWLQPLCCSHCFSRHKSLYVTCLRIGNASDDDSPAWRREAQPSRDLELKLTQCYIVLGRRRKVTIKIRDGWSRVSNTVVEVIRGANVWMWIY